MSNILEEFWYGNINLQEQSKESSRAIKELLKLMGRNRDRLHDSMTAVRMPKTEKDHTADYVACCVVFLLAPLEDVTQKLLFSIIPK